MIPHDHTETERNIMENQEPRLILFTDIGDTIIDEGTEVRDKDGVDFAVCDISGEILLIIQLLYTLSMEGLFLYLISGYS